MYVIISYHSTNRAAEDAAVKGQATKKRPRVGIVLSDDEEDADMDEEDCSDEAAGLYRISLYCDIFQLHTYCTFTQAMLVVIGEPSHQCTPWWKKRWPQRLVSEEVGLQLLHCIVIRTVYNTIPYHTIPYLYYSVSVGEHMGAGGALQKSHAALSHPAALQVPPHAEDSRTHRKGLHGHNAAQGQQQRRKKRGCRYRAHERCISTVLIGSEMDVTGLAWPYYADRRGSKFLTDRGAFLFHECCHLSLLALLSLFRASHFIINSNLDGAI